MLKKINEDEISVKEAYEMFFALQEQYTNSILVITKIQEILDFRD